MARLRGREVTGQRVSDWSYNENQRVVGLYRLIPGAVVHFPAQPVHIEWDYPMNGDKRNLGLEALDVVNVRLMGDIHAPKQGSIEKQVSALAELKRQGLVRHIGLSNVTATQIKEAQRVTPIVCVQNLYNVVHRGDDTLVDELARQGIAYVPFFPLGGFTPIQSSELSKLAAINYINNTY
jgi:aryl-alcohol dehydrogenase-like predicted oxidoreductase